MLTRRTLRGRVLLLSLALSTLAGAAEPLPPVPSPEQFFGFPMGAEKRLAGWNRIVEYFQTVDRASDRVVVQELGKTTLGRPYIMAVISTPDTIANLPHYRAQQKRLADPRKTTAEEAARIAREGKAVILIGANVHATEIGTSQAVNDLLHKLAAERSPWVDNVLRNVIVLLIPSQNPDGQQMVVDWYNENLGTPYEGAPLPELYHKYAGHDNNRDSYMLTQVETRHLARVTYKEWLPEVYLDQHEMSSNRARIFVPPYKNPPNPNVDPLLWSEVNLLGQAMAAKLHEAGKTGVIWGEQYTGFWQGANSTNPWWHNMVALLTETATSRLGSTVLQETATAEQPRIGGIQPAVAPQPADPNAPLPPPTDVQYRMNYTQPWLGGPWRLRDVVDYELLSTLGALEAVANNREMLKRNFHLMNQRAIALYAAGAPFAYLVLAAQRDRSAAARLVQLVQAGGGEVHTAAAPFAADGRTYPAGTHVILLSQPFGRWIKDLLEPQKYPDIRWPHANAPLERPYDVSAWTLGMLMGVDTPRIDAPFEAHLTLLSDDAQPPPGRLIGSGSTFILSHETNNSFIALNRLLAAGADVSWATGELRAGDTRYGPGAIVVSGVGPATIAAVARDLRIEVQATALAPDGSYLPIHVPRLALYEPWGGNIDAGWTRWVLEQHEIPYTVARAVDLRTPDLVERFDVILLPEMTTSQILRGSQGRNVRPEYRGGIGDEGVRNLQEFLRQGGTVITLGNTAQFAIEQLGAPFENVVQSLDVDTFFCPGSLLRISVDTRHPVAYGMPEYADAMFVNNGAFVTAANSSPERVSMVARYPSSGPLLRSGWIVGEARLRGTGGVLEAAIGRGRVIMHTFRVQNRGQTLGTFKLLFNSIYYGAALAPPAAAPTPTSGE